MKAVAIAACFARNTARGLASSPLTSAVAIGTIGVTLVLVGAFALLLSNMVGLLDEFGDALQVTAFLERELPAPARRELVTAARSLEGVQEVHLVTEDEALQRFRSGVGRGAALLEGLSGNPLPASLELTLAPERRSAQGLAVLERELSALPGIEDLVSGSAWVEGYLRAVALVRGLGTGLAFILCLAALLIVANTIRLAVLSRQDELEILALVGAGPVFLRTPFLLEGITQGALGGLAALALLFALFHLLLPSVEFGLELLLGGVAPHFFTAREALALVAGGAALGGIGSAAALLGGWRR